MFISVQTPCRLYRSRPLVSVNLDACLRRFNDVPAAQGSPSAVLLPRNRLSGEFLGVSRSMLS